MPPDRPRLWESFKRALGGASPSDEAEREKARPSDYALPFLAPDEPAEVVSTAEAPVPRSEPVSPVAPSAARESGGEPAAPGDLPAPPEPPAVSAPETEGPHPPRLARGLASFSRHNADREKKFRHILSDEGSGKSKKP